MKNASDFVNYFVIWIAFYLSLSFVSGLTPVREEMKERTKRLSTSVPR